MCELFDGTLRYTHMLRGVQTKWDRIIDLFSYGRDLFIPYKATISDRTPRNKWMTRDVLRTIENKENKWRVYRRNRNPSTLRIYNDARNASVDAVRKAKFNFEKSIAIEVGNGNPKAFYAYARSQTTIKETVSRVTGADGMLTMNKKETADVMNLTFQSVFIREMDHHIPQPPRVFQGPTLDDVIFTKEQVYEILVNLKESSAPGPDNLHPKVLIECAATLAQPLFEIFRESLDEGTLPDVWKLAYVTPIYKKGKKSNPLNYRPISLTSVPCKIMERLLRDKIVDHLETNNLLSKHQHGFRSRRSCLTQLLEYFSDIHNSLDSLSPVDAIYLDCQKAFDTVPHKRLLAKVKAMGITGKIYRWIEAFLTGRSQQVSIDGVLSDPLQVWSGVPQGSVLGPILFLIFINDLLDEVSSLGKLFADDSKIYRPINSQADARILQEDLLKLQEWSRKWLLQFNEDKCKVMHFGCKNPKYEYTLNSKTLEETTLEKDLGVYVTPDMKSASHVSKVAAKANSMVGWIKRTFSYIDVQMFQAFYPMLVRSHMEFAVQAWSPQQAGDIDLLEKVQQRATKLVTSIKNEPYETRRHILKLPTLQDRRLRGDLIQVFKIVHGFDNLDRCKFFKFVWDGNESSRITRGHPFKIFPPQLNHTGRQHFFDYRVIDQWNRLSDDVVKKQSISTFKKKIGELYHEWWL